MIEKIKNILTIIVTFFVIASNFILADPPNWDEDGDGVIDNYTEFANSGSITASVFINDVEVSDENDIVGAFVGDDLRGIGIADEIPPFLGGGYSFNILVYSNETSGEFLLFKFYDSSEDMLVDLNETIEFVADMNIGDVNTPQILTGTFEEIEGCTDSNACNYDANATLDDGSCFYPDENNDCIPNWDSDGDGVIDNYTEFANSGSITGSVFINNLEVGNEGDMVAAFVNGELRGVGLADEVPPFLGGGYSFNILIYSNETSGESLSFQFYYSSLDITINLNESIEFVADMNVGDVNSPQLFTGSYDEISGCIDDNACNYNQNATIDDGSCEYAQENFNCDDECIANLDCLGVCGGNATADCVGVCGGDAVVDECGACGGNGVSEACSCIDTSSLNDDGCCDDVVMGCGNPGFCGSGLVEDCAGTCDGPAVEDCTGTCNGDGVEDCAGTCNGSAVVDECGVCNGDGIADEVCDCDGNILDCLDVCGGFSVVDCFGECNGSAYIDTCDECVGGNTGLIECDSYNYSIPIHVGANLISYYSMPLDNSVSNILSSNTNDYIFAILSESNSAVNIGNNSWTGSLTHFEFDKGYWIRTTNATNITLNNSWDNLENPVYHLHSGANLISFPFNSTIVLENAIPDSLEIYFNAILGESVSAVRLDDGNWVGSLSSFDAENGYWFIVNDDFEFSYNINEEIAFNRSNNNSIESLHIQSSKQAFYFLNNQQDLLLNDDDWIIVTNNGLIVGSRKVNNGIDIPVMGYDQAIYSEGFCNEGDIPKFQILKSNGKIVDLYGEISPWSNMQISFINLYMSDTYFNPSEIQILQTYPNPFNPIINIDIEVNSMDYVNIEVFNLNGQFIDRLESKVLEKGQYTYVWNADNYHSGVYFVKISSSNQSQVKKITLIK